MKLHFFGSSRKCTSVTFIATIYRSLTKGIFAVDILGFQRIFFSIGNTLLIRNNKEKFLTKVVTAKLCNFLTVYRWNCSLFVEFLIKISFTPVDGEKYFS